MAKNKQEKHPKSFISYSHDSPKHADRILESAKKLRLEWIDTILDQYEEAPSEGWPKWMYRQIENDDFILPIYTDRYYKKVIGAVDDTRRYTLSGAFWIDVRSTCQALQDHIDYNREFKYDFRGEFL